MRKVLCIAYHFPPVQGSSGIQRTLKFATYLRDHDWESMVLTVHPRAYESTSPDQLGEIPDGMLVRRSFALDSARQLAVFGRYPDWLALPDRYWSWLIGGLWDGWSLIRRHRPAAIWSTYPIATAHLLAAQLHRLTGLPWIADFRDSMTDDVFPPDPLRWRTYRRLERHVVEHASRCVFTTEGTREMYISRYPQVPPEKFTVIPNGYDEENFKRAEEIAVYPSENEGRRIRLVHSGILYPSERDPSHFFEALRRLKSTGAIDSRKVQIVLRATGHDDFHKHKLAELGIDDIVDLQPSVAYRDALAEMLTADGLLLFQASNSNHQVPAKLYEYMRAGRPILALTDPRGDTAKELRAAGVASIVPLDNADEITRALPDFIEGIVSGVTRGVTREQSRRYSRAGGAERLAWLLDSTTN